MNTVLQAQNYLSTEEVATALDLTDGRVRQLLRSGEISGDKLGKRSWAIPSAEVERFKRLRAKDLRNNRNGEK